ncbi:translation initiation factor 2 [Luedemannella helvata]|uniref:translation initiation factor 2 n=1 Tax=Luedemannella helvata TaxID=349315 RepID=UPI0031D364EA
MQPDDAYWRRPAEEGDPQRPAADADRPTYTGPPPSNPPPTGWRPEHITQPPPPRSLPPQDHDRIDTAEARAKGLTLGVAILAGAVLIVLVCVLCARFLF